MPPRLAARLNTRRRSKTCLAASYVPASKHTMPPNPVICRRAIAWSGCDARPGYSTRRHPPVALQPARHVQRAFVLARDAELQGLEATAERVGGRRLEHAAEELARGLQPIDHRVAADQRARRHVAVAVEVLRRRCMTRSIAERERLLVHGAREGVVDDRRHAGLPACRRHARDVHAPQRRIDRRLEPQHACLRPDEPSGVGQILERRKPGRDAEAGQILRHHLQRAAVDRGTAHDFLPRLQQAEQRRRRGRHPR